MEPQTASASKPGLEIHVSGIRQFMQCRKAWDITDFSRGNRVLRDEDTQSFFLRGTASHKFWEHYYLNNDRNAERAWIAYEKFWAEEAPNWRGSMLHSDTTTMLKFYLKSLVTRELTKEVPDSKLKFLATEQKFRIAITNPITRRALPNAYYAGTFDGIVEYEGGIYIWENKTSSRPEHLLASIDTHDNQSRLYVLAARTLFPNVKGIIYNVMKTAIPPMPEVVRNKTGDPEGFVRLSQNKKWAGSFTHFKHYAGGPLPADYTDYVSDLLGAEGSWFKRRVVVPDAAQNMEMLIELFDIAKEMLRKDLPIWKARNSFVCDKCPFYSHCYRGVSLDDITMPRGSHNEW